MPFNPQIFDIAGGLQQGMMSGAAGLSRGLEKLTERQQELADEDRKRARVAESTRKILVESGLATEDQVKTLSGEQAAGMLEGAIIKHKRERERDEDIFRLAQQRAQEKRWETEDERLRQQAQNTLNMHADDIAERRQARIDAAADRAEAIRFEFEKLKQNNDHFGKTLNKLEPRIIVDQTTGDISAAYVKDGQLHVLRDPQSASFNRGNDSAGYRAVLSQFGAKPAAQIPFPESLRDTDSIERLKSEIAAQDAIILESGDTSQNPTVKRAPQFGYMGMPIAPTEAQKYSSVAARRAAYAAAWKRKQELIAKLNALIPQSLGESPASGD